MAAVALGVGWHRWTRTEIALRTHTSLPGFTGGIVVLAAIGVLMAGALVSAVVPH
ncbi:hypothetical protein [Nocardioides convexus]|uniref:hypothetical protein n=1 Tax=Nocardioides convexus TaxID=2712224 RepID=UPI0024189D40|nr:hypothetical protein [Nocardioides convexus]